MFRVHQWLPLPLPHVSLKTGTPGPVSWLDIETTGLSPSTSHVTLVGCILPAAHGRELIQLFADAPEEEAEVLRSAFRVLEETAAVITFNGRRFDVPYLLRRSEACSVQMPRLFHRDLCDDVHALDPSRRLISDHRLQTLMRHFGLSRQDEHSGRDMVFAYRRWLQRHLPEDRESIMDHNADDLLHLPELTDLLLRPYGAARRPG